MARDRTEIVKAGSQYRADYLVEQAGVTLARAGKEATVLGRFGVTKDLLAKAADCVKKLAAATKDRALAGADAQSATRAQDESAGQAKDWLRQALLIGDNAFDGEAEIVDEFHKGGKVGASVPKLVGKVRQVLGLLRKDPTVVAKFGATADFVKQGDGLAESLVSADTRQEGKREALPKGTEAFYFDKGTLYFHLKTINRAGRAAHVTEPEAAAAWNLSILHRRGKGGGTAGAKA